MAALNLNIPSRSGDEIRADLETQLRAKGADIVTFMDLIDQAIFFRDAAIAMQKDVKERGLSYLSISSTGKEYMKDNPSIKLAMMYNKQYLAILTQLDLTTKTIEISTSDDEDL